MKKYLPAKTGGGGEPVWPQVDSPVSSVRPLESRKELEWLPACLYFLNLPKRIGVEKSVKYPPASPDPLPDERCHTFSWLCELIQEAAGPACEQSFAPSTSGTAAGAQVGTRRSFEGFSLQRKPPRSPCSLGWSSRAHNAQVDLSCSKSLLHVLWSSCSCSFCLKFRVLLNHWAVNTNPFFSGLEASGKDSNSAAAELLRQNSPQVHCCEGRPGARRLRKVFHC